MTTPGSDTGMVRHSAIISAAYTIFCEAFWPTGGDKPEWFATVDAQIGHIVDTMRTPGDIGPCIAQLSALYGWAAAKMGLEADAIPEFECQALYHNLWHLANRLEITRYVGRL